MGTIWVHAEANDGKVASITLELLAKARELGDAEAFYAEVTRLRLEGLLAKRADAPYRPGRSPHSPVAPSAARVAMADDAPDIVNNSWGFRSQPGECVEEFADDIQVLRAAGIAVVFSAGNGGPTAATSISPASRPLVVVPVPRAT